MLHGSQIVAVHVEQVERLEDRFLGVPLASSAAESLLQAGEAGNAALVHDDGLAVNDGRVDRQLLGRGNSGRKTLAPVVAASRDSHGLAVGDVQR